MGEQEVTTTSESMEDDSVISEYPTQAFQKQFVRAIYCTCTAQCEQDYPAHFPERMISWSIVQFNRSSNHTELLQMVFSHRAFGNSLVWMKIANFLQHCW
eukprot:3815272-Amphidinium_carterae.2